MEKYTIKVDKHGNMEAMGFWKAMFGLMIPQGRRGEIIDLCNTIVANRGESKEPLDRIIVVQHPNRQIWISIRDEYDFSNPSPISGEEEMRILFGEHKA